MHETDMLVTRVVTADNVEMHHGVVQQLEIPFEDRNQQVGSEIMPSRIEGTPNHAEEKDIQVRIQKHHQ